MADVPRQHDRAFRRGDEDRKRGGVESAPLLDAVQGQEKLRGDTQGDMGEAEFPADWFDRTSACMRDCENCGYCESVLSKVDRSLVTS